MLQCTNCNYKFEPRGKTPHKCPYCDKEGTLEKTKSIQDFIDEVDSEMVDRETRS